MERNRKYCGTVRHTRYSRGQPPCMNSKTPSPRLTCPNPRTRKASRFRRLAMQRFCATAAASTAAILWVNSVLKALAGYGFGGAMGTANAYRLSMHGTTACTTTARRSARTYGCVRPGRTTFAQVRRSPARPDKDAILERKIRTYVNMRKEGMFVNGSSVGTYDSFPRREWRGVFF